jgi:hypothetical protein
MSDDLIDNSMEPDLDPPEPGPIYPDGIVGDLMRQRDLAQMALASAQAQVAQYQGIVDAQNAQITSLNAAISTLGDSL